MALTDSLISYWRLEEASGTRADSGGGGNTLTDVNTVTQAAGKAGNAALFTAANSEQLTHADSAALSTGNIDYTLSAQVYFNSQTSERAIVSKFDAAGQREYTLRLNSISGKMQFIISSNGTTLTTLNADTFGALSNSIWYAVVAWHDSVNDVLGISVNDVSNTVSYSSGSIDGTSLFRLGDNNFGDFMDGRIDEVGFWKRVLTAAERTALYSGNPLTGTAAIAVGQGGAITGAAAPSGSAALAIGQSGSAGGAGAAAGTASLAIGQGGAIGGAANVAGSSAMLVGQGGALRGDGALGGAGLLVIGQSGSLTGAAAIAGTGPLVIGQAAAIVGAGALAGAAAMVIGQAGASSGVGALAGSSGLLIGQSGAVSANGAASGAAGLVIGQAGALAGSGALSGTAPLTFNAVMTAMIVALVELHLSPRSTLLRLAPRSVELHLYPRSTMLRLAPRSTELHLYPRSTRLRLPPR